MNVKEKLVELLNEIIDGGFKWHNYLYESGEQLNNDDIASSLIANGVTVQEWIPVEDRLPDWRDGKVLVFTKYGFSICERTVNNRWRGQHANWITHWAYLPKPPKGE